MFVAVIVPVLGRPDRVGPLVRSIRQDDRCWPMFMCSPGDDAEIEEVRRYAESGPALMHVVEWEADRGDYARKVNRAFRVAVEKRYDWALLAADDLVFHPGWLDACLAVHAETDACVVGTNDLGNALVMRGGHATHPLVHRDYLACGTVDEDGKLLHEGYDHQYVDTEFVETAIWRGTFAPALEAHVEHLHPFWHKAERDATYAKGQRAAAADRALFLRRRRMWR